MTNSKSTRRGFSLLELTLVLAIMATLMAVAAVAIAGRGESAKRKATWASMEVIRQAIESYHLDKSVYPPDLQALTVGSTAYLDATRPLEDGWRQPFLYSVGGTQGRPYSLISKGPDGKYPSADDLDVWRRERD